MTHRRATLILVGCAFIWGASFTLNKMALASLSPMVQMGSRFTISTLMLSWIYPRLSRSDWAAGIKLGLIFAIQLALFVYGLANIPASRSAFLFSIQTPLVPTLVLFLAKQWPTGREIAAVLVAVVGAWFLTGTVGTGQSLSWGDGAMLTSALIAAGYVVAAGHWSPHHEPLHLLAAQMPVLAGVAAIIGLTVGHQRAEINSTTLVLIPFLALSSIATFGGQLLGQKLIKPTEAALIYALEPVVAAAVGMFTLGERFSGPQWVGASLVLVACLIVQFRRTASPAA
jgi:drug/metabolite transporter (DMT)-like permease